MSRNIPLESQKSNPNERPMQQTVAEARAARRQTPQRPEARAVLVTGLSADTLTACAQTLLSSRFPSALDRARVYCGGEAAALPRQDEAAAQRRRQSAGVPGRKAQEVEICRTSSHGSVIMISSVNGPRGSAELDADGFSGADMQQAGNIAAEWGAKNIRANAIALVRDRTHFARVLRETLHVSQSHQGDPAAGSFITGGPSLSTMISRPDGLCPTTIEPRPVDGRSDGSGTPAR